MSFTNRLAAKGHAPDLPVFFDRLDRLDAFRLKVYSVYSLAGDLDDALAGDLLPRSLHSLRGRRIGLNIGNSGDRRQIGDTNMASRSRFAAR